MVSCWNHHYDYFPLSNIIGGRLFSQWRYACWKHEGKNLGGFANSIYSLLKWDTWSIWKIKEKWKNLSTAKENKCKRIRIVLDECEKKTNLVVETNAAINSEATDLSQKPKNILPCFPSFKACIRETGWGKEVIG